jgi:hypothetical protein
MRFQKAEQCSAARHLEVLGPTLPPAEAAPSGKRPRRFVVPALLACAAAGAALHAPNSIPPALSSASAGASLVFTFWASIMLEATPFVFAGSALAAALHRLPIRGIAAPLIAIVAPGCDCSTSGFAAALARTSLPVTGFVLTWNAVCGPAALVATHAALGDHLLLARLAGGATAALATAALWRWVPAAPIPSKPTASHGNVRFVDTLGVGLLNLSWAALAAALLRAIAPNVLRASTSPMPAAIVGALLSPCSTADAILARVMLADHASQAAFVVAAQCVDIRQIAMLHRHFGAFRALLACAAGCAGCALAAMAAR